MSDVLALRFIKGVFSLGTSAIVSLASSFLIVIIATRFVPKDQYGIYILLLVIVSFFVIITDFGLSLAATRYIPSVDREDRTKLVNSVLIIRLIIIIVASPILMIFGEALTRLIFKSKIPDDMQFYFIILFIFQSFEELFSHMLQGFHFYKKIAIIRISAGCLQLIIVFLALVLLHIGIMGLIYAMVINLLFSCIAQFLLIPGKKGWKIETSLIYEMIKFGFPLYLNNILTFIFQKIGILVISALLNTTSVAYYAVAGKIPSICSRLFESFRGVYIPHMSDLFHKKKDEMVEATLNESLRLISFITITVALIATIFRTEIIELLFSSEYLPSSNAMPLLFACFSISAVGNILGTTLVAAGHSSYPVKFNIIMTTITIIGNLILIPNYGFMGAVYASLIGYYIVNPIILLFMRREHIRVSLLSYLIPNLIFWPSYFLIVFSKAGYFIGVIIVGLFLFVCIIFSVIKKSDITILLKTVGIISVQQPSK